MKLKQIVRGKKLVMNSGETNANFMPLPGSPDAYLRPADTTPGRAGPLAGNHFAQVAGARFHRTGWVLRRSMPFCLAALLAVAGAGLTIGAIMLAVLGQPSAELVAGPLLAASGLSVLRRPRLALPIFLGYFLVVWLTAIWEVGPDGWSLLPRVDFACLALPLFALPGVGRGPAPGRDSPSWWSQPAFLWAAPFGTILLVWLAAIAIQRTAPPPATAATARPAMPANSAASTDWPAFGGNSNATKFSALASINRTNAGQLKLLWEHVEPVKPGGASPPVRKDEATPLKVGNKVFVCTSDNVVLALDAESGGLVWRYDPHTDERGVQAAICRGLAYVVRPDATACPQRILMGTIDARLIAIDAQTGRACPDFGPDSGTPGQVDLTLGLQPVKKGYYYLTSPPTVVNGVAVIGGLVRDNEEVGEPSGVIRGFDTRSGRLLWAWDMGRPSRGMALYSRGTPNAWTVFSGDPGRGLVFVPLGNGTPDFVARHRNPAWDRYSSALVALDVRTGVPRWSFQTVHRDLWDNDLSAQPVLADWPSPAGSIPVVMIGSKRGQVFVLDRRDGHPVSPVREFPTAQTDVPGERTSPTQPLSVGMPDLGGARLGDADMWGTTPFDRMYCRIKLRMLRYEGPFTPPSRRGSLIYPGMAGGVDWGGLTFDPGRSLLLVPTMHLAQIVTLIPRGARVGGNAPQRGMPYSANLQQFMTRLGVPCQRPPYAQLTAIDMKSRRIVWQRSLGTAETIGPLGIPSRLPLTIGAPPLIGGGVATAGDITLIGAVGDRRLRVLDSLDGRELWSTRLPAGNQATPITYQTPRSHRQLVVMVSGSWADLGNAHKVPTHVLAYALDR